MSTIDFSTTTALVTGANRGFGRHLAEQLVQRGATVYAAARNPEPNKSNSASSCPVAPYAGCAANGPWSRGQFRRPD